MVAPKTCKQFRNIFIGEKFIYDYQGENENVIDAPNMYIYIFSAE